jgi:hypothetical protein
MTQQAASYTARLDAELRRLDCGSEQRRRIMAEVFGATSRDPGIDLSVEFGPAEQFAQDALAGRRPLRTRYLQQLGAELAGRGLTGGQVGQVLAEVDEYVRDSGQDPTMAFGTPAAYADDVAAAAGPVTAGPSNPLWLTLLGAAVDAAGMFLVVEGAAGLLHGQGTAPLTAGVLAAVALVTALETGIGPLARRSGLVSLLSVVAGVVGSWAVQAAALIWFREPVLTELPAVAMAASGVALLAASGWAVTRWTRAAMPEPVTDPRPGAGTTDPLVWDALDRDTLARRTVVGAAALTAVRFLVLTAVVMQFR